MSPDCNNMLKKPIVLQNSGKKLHGWRQVVKFLEKKTKKMSFYKRYSYNIELGNLPLVHNGDQKKLQNFGNENFNKNAIAKNVIWNFQLVFCFQKFNQWKVALSLWKTSGW